MPDSATPTVLAELARRRETLAQGPEPVFEIADDHRWAASMRRAAEWIRKNLSESAVGLPFSFGYNGKEMFRSRSEVGKASCGRGSPEHSVRRDAGRQRCSATQTGSPADL